MSLSIFVVVADQSVSRPVEGVTGSIYHDYVSLASRQRCSLVLRGGYRICAVYILTMAIVPLR